MCRHIIVSVDWIVLNLARMMMNVRRDHMHGALRVWQGMMVNMWWDILVLVVTLLVLVRREMWR